MSDLEGRLLEFWKADAIVWRRRTHHIYEATGDELTKYDEEKLRSNAKQNLKNKQKTIARGGRVHKVKGTMRLVETRDRLTEPTAHCDWCGDVFSRNPHPRGPCEQIYCSTRCRKTAGRLRRKARLVANG